MRRDDAAGIAGRQLEEPGTVPLPPGHPCAAPRPHRSSADETGHQADHDVQDDGGQQALHSMPGWYQRPACRTSASPATHDDIPAVPARNIVTARRAGTLDTCGGTVRPGLA